VSELRRLNRGHWMIAPSILETYTERPAYFRAFGELYGGLAVEAIQAGDTETACALIQRATRHAWIYLWAIAESHEVREFHELFT